MSLHKKIEEEYHEKISSWILAITLMLSLGVTVFANGNEGKEFDIRKNVAPDHLQFRKIIDSDQAVDHFSMAESKTTKGKISLFSMSTGGGEYPYNPSYWNDSANVYRANCYGYVLNRIANNTTKMSIYTHTIKNIT